MPDQEVHRYAYWGEVPAGTYMTKSHLQRLTLPRQPGGPARATVEGRDGAGRQGVFDLWPPAKRNTTARHHVGPDHRPSESRETAAPPIVPAPSTLSGRCWPG